MAPSAKRQYIIHMLKFYREMPFLWNKKHLDYGNKIIKQKSYEVLLSVYKYVDPNATTIKLRRKLQNLKCCYFKELRKVEQSRKSGRPEDVYKPTLWYYEAISFLGDKYEQFDHDLTIEIEDTDEEPESNGIEDAETMLPPEVILEEVNRPNGEKDIEDKSSANITEQEWEILAKSLAIQLRDINKDQLIIANKIISETIYYAKLSKLSEKSFVALEPPRPTPQQNESYEAPSTSWQIY